MVDVESKLASATAEAGDQVCSVLSEKATLEERVSTQEQELRELRSAREEQNASMASLAEAKEALSLQVHVLEPSKTAAEERYSTQTDRVKELEAELTSLRSREAGRRGEQACQCYCGSG
ncbi:hypothetical protein P43SY_010426 [Pythium insidiosum]|uniref:Uncharacterized protein n=1 Tax=Pythium insidiosum TaxID=114742 RepID=A0AAD5LSF5_PYTIN|nr:hypothetical protein P43SY_010426 [Pythium insidiosum]